MGVVAVYFQRNDIPVEVMQSSPQREKRRGVFAVKTPRRCSCGGPIASPDARFAASLSSCVYADGTRERP